MCQTRTRKPGYGPSRQARGRKQDNSQRLGVASAVEEEQWALVERYSIAVGSSTAEVRAGRNLGVGEEVARGMMDHGCEHPAPQRDIQAHLPSASGVETAGTTGWMGRNAPRDGAPASYLLCTVC